jgi:hypothetical protein
MLPGLPLPASLLEMLAVPRPCFTAPGFVTFCRLVAGLAGRVRRRIVVGVLPGGCLQHLWPHDRDKHEHMMAFLCAAVPTTSIR